ncbi:MAG: SET domain-containing protein [Fimbriimonadaceae bacterium]|nr:SET domain-containing protein [Chitinophagales bacterium]
MHKKNTIKKYSPQPVYEIYAKEADYLFLKNSQIPDSGKGLYTAIIILKNERIAIFKGENLTDEEAKKRASNKKDAYFINMIDGTIMDSANRKCFAKYANDAAGFIKTKLKNNAVISLDDKDNVCIVAIKNIKAGEEVFCSYGDAYWKNYKKHSIQ